MGTIDDLIGAMLECIFYGTRDPILETDLLNILPGVYCVIVVLYLQIQFKRKDEYKGILLYAFTANFILCTAYLAVGMADALLAEGILNPAQLVLSFIFCASK